MSTGRNFDEVLRVLDSCQLTAKYKVATPVNWKQGEDVIIVPAVSDEEARKAYPDGWKAPKPYLQDRAAAQVAARSALMLHSLRPHSCGRRDHPGTRFSIASGASAVRTCLNATARVSAQDSAPSSVPIRSCRSSISIWGRPRAWPCTGIE